MKKNILIIGLGWQGQKFLDYFVKNKNYYRVFGCCKTEKTKKNIISKYGINVSINYKKILINKFDLIISNVFPTDIQYDIVRYILENTNNKVLIDLPISFNLYKLKSILKYEKLYLFNIEHYTKIFKFITTNKDNIEKVEAILYINKANLVKQNDPRKALIVDKFYMLNNLLSLDYTKINIFYKSVNRKIKDIEFYYKVFLKDKIVYYKYEDSNGILLIDGKNIVDKITYSNILNNIIGDILFSDIYKQNSFYKSNHLDYWSHFIN